MSVLKAGLPNVLPDASTSQSADTVALWEMVTATQNMLAQASQINEKLVDLTADLAARLYCLEFALGMRASGSLDHCGLRFLGGTSVATYHNVRRRILAEKLGILVPDASG